MSQNYRRLKFISVIPWTSHRSLRMLFSSCVALQMAHGSLWNVSILRTSVFGDSKSTILRTKYYQLGSTAAL